MQRFEQLTVANVVMGLTAALFNPTQFMKAQKAIITVETADFRFKTDGNDPTITSGHLVGSGDTIELDAPDEIKKFRALRTTGTSAVINVTYLFENDR